jgi:hypothetical protein
MTRGVNVFGATGNTSDFAGGIYLTTNSGTSWSSIKGNLPASIGFSSLALSETAIFASVNGAGDSVWTRPLAGLLAPDSPTLVSPSDASTSVATNPTLAWNAVTEATSYTVQVSTSSSFGTTVVNQSGLTSALYSASGLGNNTVYYWRVNATNSIGTSYWSAVNSFTTIVAVPSAPTLSAPADGATSISPNPTLSWNTVSGATSYAVQVSTSSDFSALVADQTGIVATTLALSGLSTGTLYYWRVAATNVAGTSAWSSTRSFTTIVPPSAPALSSPANASVSISTNPTFSWSAATGAASYSVQVSTASDFSSLAVNQMGITSTSYATTGLYYWQVNATNSGGTSAWTSAWSFTTVVAPPSAPTLSTPADAATNTAISPTLTWNAAIGADSYILQVSASSSFSSFVVNQSGITAVSYVVSGLSNNTAYYWRMNATNAGGTSAWSIGRSFTTIIAAPGTPVLSSPSNVATNAALNQSVAWGSVSTAASYALQVSTASDFSALVVNQAGITATSYALSSLTTSTVYYWRVNATNVGGTSAWSTAWSFTTIVAAPSAPVLSSPSNSATSISTSPTLSWSAATGATSYSVQVSTASDFSALVVNQSGITTTSYTASGLGNNALYYWRVNSTNAGGTSGWTSAWSFTTIVASPSNVVLFSPTNTATSVAISPTLSWSTATGATSYSLQVSTTSDFSALVVDQSGLTTTSYALTTLINNTLYYWRVSATNAGGTNPWTSPWSFTTIIAAPLVPVLSAPANVAASVSVNPTLSWAASSGATSYSLQVSTASDFSAIAVNQPGITSTSFAPSGLSNNTVYYWRVNSTNVGGTSAWTLPWSFTTIVAAPVAPVLSSPISAAVNVPLSTSLAWSAVLGADSYTLQVSTSPTFATFTFNQTALTTTTYPISTITNSTRYYWRVSASNVGGTSSYASDSFTTVIAIAAAPVPISPDSGISDLPVSVSLRWQSAQRAVSYRLQVSTSSSFVTTLKDTAAISDTAFSFSGLLNSTAYYWRVLAANAGGSSAWSRTMTFTTICDVPAKPILVSPTADTIRVDSVPCRWNAASPRVLKYHLQIFTDSALTALFLSDSTIVDTTRMLKNLVSDTRYWIRVRAYNIAGWGGFSDVRRVLVKIPPTHVLPTAFTMSFSGAAMHNGVLRYAVPKQVSVSISIYDIRGRVLFDYSVLNQQAGVYSVQANTNRFAAGHYILRFAAGTFKRTMSFLVN